MRILRLLETNKITKFDETDMDSFQAAIDRLIHRDWPNSFGNSLDVEDTGGCEICETAGDLTEHTGEYVHFKIEAAK